MADVPQTFAGTNGVDGKVRNHGNSNILAGITSWTRSSKTNITRFLHYEAPASANGVVQPTKIKADGDNQVKLSGFYNLDSTAATEGTATQLTNGAAVALDLYGSRGGAVGYPNVIGIVSDFQVTSKVGQDPFTFECTVEVSGVFPAWGPIT